MVLQSHQTFTHEMKCMFLFVGLFVCFLGSVFTCCPPSLAVWLCVGTKTAY